MRPAWILATAVALGAGLPGTYLALGGGSYTTPAVADPCVTREWRNPDGLERVAEQIVLSSLDGAACDLHVSREELVLALATDSSRARSSRGSTASTTARWKRRCAAASSGRWTTRRKPRRCVGGRQTSSGPRRRGCPSTSSWTSCSAFADAAGSVTQDRGLTHANCSYVAFSARCVMPALGAHPAPAG